MCSNFQCSILLGSDFNVSSGFTTTQQSQIFMYKMSQKISDNETTMNSTSRPSSREAIKKSVMNIEFHDWQQSNFVTRQRIRLKRSQINPDATTTLEFDIGETEQTFSLQCPPNYPSYESEDNFFVETQSDLQVWCNTLNEYILDSGKHLYLNDILDKGLSLYSSGDAASKTEMSSEDNMEDDFDDDENFDMDDEEEDEDEEEDDGQIEDMLDQNLTWELELSSRKKKWRLKEAALRAERKKHFDDELTSEDLSLYQDPSSSTGPKRQPKQVFSSEAASGILINDLVSIIETAAGTGISVDTIGDNIFQWSVKLNDFDFSNPLNNDLKELKTLYGYDYIELQLDFSMDLYPFFPPSVKVIRPRLQGSLMFGVTHMDILKLSYWDPAKNMKSVLEQIKSLLQTWARIDCHSERNDPVKYQDGAYNYLEHHLLKLAFVSEVSPRAIKKYGVSEKSPTKKLPASAMEDTIDVGTPFIGNDDKNEKIDNIEKGKSVVFKALDYVRGAFVSDNRPKGVGYSSYAQKGWDIKTYVAAQKEKDKQLEQLLEKIHLELQNLRQLSHANNRLKDHYAVVEGSALIPFLESKLKDNSFLEICNHATVFQYVIQIIKELVVQPCFNILLGSLPNQSISLHSLIMSLESQAQILLKTVGKTSITSDTEKSSCVKMAVAVIEVSKQVSKAHENIKNHQEVSAMKESQEAFIDQDPKNPLAASTGESVSVIDKLKQTEKMYKFVLKDIQLNTTEFLVSGKDSHAYASESNNAKPSSATIFRVAQELSSLSTSLPLDFSSAIFLQTDDERPTIVRVLITGPEDTPYTGGCFIFDIFFPGNYPDIPPKVRFRTTGGGTVRFNPNLYNNGKVCLSLLGTWSGAEGENWTSVSTVLQILVSIQSLILCSEPYFNEPGYQKSYGTTSGNSQSHAYSETVFSNNLKFAVLEQLKNPPNGFEQIIQTHFYLKKDFLLDEFEKMSQKYNNKRIKDTLEEVKNEFLKLKSPAVLKKSDV